MPRDEEYAQGASASVRERRHRLGAGTLCSAVARAQLPAAKGPVLLFQPRDSQVQALRHSWLGVRMNFRPHSPLSLEPAAPLPFRLRAVRSAWGRALLRPTPCLQGQVLPRASPWLPRSTNHWALSRSVPSAGTRVSHCACLAADLRSLPCVVFPGHPTGRYRQLCPHHQVAPLPVSCRLPTAFLLLTPIPLPTPDMSS